MFIDKTNCNYPKAYTYMLEFTIDNKKIYYYGVRYGNLKLNLSPSNDLFSKYFTSSKYVKNLLMDSIIPTKIIIHKVFDSVKQACEFEVKFLQRVKAKYRTDFLNQVDHFDNSLPNNKGRKLSKEQRKRISLVSSKAQSSKEYREKRSKEAKERWSTKEFRNHMEEKYESFKNSEEGKSFYKNRNNSFSGKTHSSKTKELMSKSMKEAAKKRDFTKAASKRKIFKCPICNTKIQSSNFDRHTKSKHEIVYNMSEKLGFEVSKD